MTMAQIKEFYIAEFKDSMPQLQRVLRWRMNNLPAAGDSSGTTLFIGSIISLVGSFYLGCAAELLYHYTHNLGGALKRFPIYLGPIPITGLSLDVPVFLLAFAQYALYFRFARHRRELKARVQSEIDKLSVSSTILPREF